MRRPVPLLPGLAVLAVLAVVAAVTAGALLFSGDTPQPAAPSGGRATHFASARLSGAADVGPGLYGYVDLRMISVRPDGTQNAPGQWHLERYIAPTGDAIQVQRGATPPCYSLPHAGPAGFATPTAAFLAGLPTEPRPLEHYLVRHVAGSRSVDEAMFLAVGDLLRQYDPITSPRLRAALIDVLSRSRLVTVHRGDFDILNRPAIRVDFVDQRNRPLTLASLYFDPTTFRLLEQRTGTTTVKSAPTPARTTGPATVDVVASEKVVRQLPRTGRSGSCPAARPGR